MIKDYFNIPYKEIKTRKLRSFLTLLGIIIGIAAVISLITLGAGLQNAIAEQFAALGNDKLFVAPKGSTLTPGLSIAAVKITEKDNDVIKRTPGIRMTSGMIYSSAKVEFNDFVRFFLVTGMSTDPAERKLIGEANSYKLLKGRFHQKGDKYKAVLGFDYTTPGLFQKAVEVGDKILVHGTEFKVIGFWQKIGSPPDDRSVIIPLEVYQDIFNKPKELGIIIAQIQPGEDINAIEEKVTKELRKSRGVKEDKEDFTVETPENLLSAFTTILDIVQIVLIGIAGISLLVGGIGIMNTMYTAVLERTKQIGIFKALGAKNSQILSLFLVESGLYGLVGGTIGLLLGIIFAKSVESLFKIFIGPAFLSVKISIPLLLGTLLFSFVVGCLSGIAPARKASKLNPVDSLRYE